jgi:MoaA/NifB/PqqE/SkfB family radical SAM enzyme
VRWGKTTDDKDDPQFSPVGPELLDIEVSDVCSQGCSHCYKSNSKNGENMTFDTFRVVLDKMPPNLHQVAFGVGDIDANPDLFKMFAYCREKGVIPNITINGYRLTNEIVHKLAYFCGAVAVSNYNEDVCFTAVNWLINAGLKQVNIHQLLSRETLSQCYNVIDSGVNDSRLSKLGAIVFMTLKPKGERNTYHSVSREEYENLVQYLLKSGVGFGFDSCGANNFRKVVNDTRFDRFIEPCESTCFSSYVNVKGYYYPCSFAEGGGQPGLNVLRCKDFLKDIWFNLSTKFFRENLISKERDCPIYNITFV